MPGFCVLTYFNPASEAALLSWLDTHVPFLKAQGGLNRLHVGKLSAVQTLRSQPQLHRGILLHDFTVDADPARIAAMRDALQALPLNAEEERPHIRVFRWVTDWARPVGATGPLPTFTHWTIGLANCGEGQEEAYHRWNDQHHVPDVLAVPGVVAMRRGRLSDLQISADIPHPRKFLGVVALHTDNSPPMLAEMKARSMGKSTSGIQFTLGPPGVVMPDTKNSVFDMDAALP